jgi:beta-1,4-mannooligosaccharide/beta-1,4-mannosyl-N-acetylglucosamine phosphorylase
VTELVDPGIMVRYQVNPILDCGSIPFPSTLVYNAGVVRFRGRYVTVFRNDYGFSMDRIGHKFEGTNLGMAYSEDGIHWEAQPKPILEHLKNEENIRAYDPRLFESRERQEGALWRDLFLWCHL